jgi:hypothetical protein
MTGSTGTIINNVIAHNSGSGIECDYLSPSPITINNNTISYNGFCGILCYFTPKQTISNNVITSNKYGIYASGGEQSAVPSLYIAHNNVWGNSAGNYWEFFGVLSYDGSGWSVSRPFKPEPGTCEINQAPLFTNPTNNDYHLRSQAGRWDPDTKTWIQDDVTSPGIDAGDPASAIGLEPFPNGGIINMGAYGGTEQASKSYFGEPVCETIIVGDINGDCRVDFADFVFMALHWLEDNHP